MRHSNFHIINAAAGSGKTYTLVYYFLKQLLSSKSPHPSRQMLALTFTNKAVNEMKLRILNRLYDLSKPNPEDVRLQKKLSDALAVDSLELARRAEKICEKSFWSTVVLM